MPQFDILLDLVKNPPELLNGHFFQFIEINNRPRIRRLAADDETFGGLILSSTMNTVVEVDAGQRLLNELKIVRFLIRKHTDQKRLPVEAWDKSREVPEYFSRVGSVSATAPG
jgi:hypothetical protein